jgi:hypothetical protein
MTQTADRKSWSRWTVVAVVASTTMAAGAEESSSVDMTMLAGIQKVDGFASGQWFGGGWQVERLESCGSSRWNLYVYIYIYVYRQGPDEGGRYRIEATCGIQIERCGHSCMLSLTIMSTHVCAVHGPWMEGLRMAGDSKVAQRQKRRASRSSQSCLLESWWSFKECKAARRAQGRAAPEGRAN